MAKPIDDIYINYYFSVMQSKKVIFAAALLVFSILFLFSSDVIAEAGNNDHKINICHSTSSDSNPYTKNSVDKDSVFTKGHSGHTGPIWFQGIDGD